MKLLYLVLNRAVEAWKRPPRGWCEAKTQFAILFGDRFTVCCTKPTPRTKLPIGQYTLTQTDQGTSKILLANGAGHTFF